MIQNAKLTYDTLAHVWVLTITRTSRSYIALTRDKAIESCLQSLKPDDTIRIKP